MLSNFVLDENLIDIQNEFLMNDKLRIATFYPKDFRSCLMCAVFGHMEYQLNEKENGKLTEILTYCIRCKKETIEKFYSNKIPLELLRN